MPDLQDTLPPLLAKLAIARQLPVNRLLFAHTHPSFISPRIGKMVLLHPYVRFILPIEGAKNIRFTNGTKVFQETLKPGEAVFGKPGAWIEEIWDTPHKMISVIFNESYIRIISIQHDGRSPDPNGPTQFFHTATPPNAAIKSLLQAIVAANVDSEGARLCFSALLAWLEEHLQAENRRELTPEDRLWNRVLNYLLYFFHNDIGLEDAAEAAGTTPARFSQLLHARTGMSFREYLNHLRLDYAANLLKTSDISVEETAMQCGFNYTSYFIRVFEKRYGLTPSNYRILPEKLPTKESDEEVKSSKEQP